MLMSSSGKEAAMIKTDFFINGEPVSHYGVRLLSDWTVKDAAPETTILQPQNGTSFIVFGNQIGLKTVTLPIHIFGESRSEVRIKRSQLTAALSNGIVDLELPDEFLYRAVIKDSGDISDILPDGRKASCKYIMYAMQFPAAL